MRIASAAIAYWAVVFALGFVLGTIRVMWIIPLVGLLPATALELPVILLASWLVANWVLHTFSIVLPSEALAMGALAFALLMASECVLAVVLMGQSPVDWIAGLLQPHALLGLAGQLVFALMPWLIAQRGLRR